MQQPILVAYATKHGATAEIAQRIAAVLRAAGFTADPVDLESGPELAGYGAVVLGSAVYMGGWRKEAADFLKHNEPALAGLPVWLFSSGPTGQGDPVALTKGWRFPDALLPIAVRIGVRDMALFGGDLEKENLGFLEKMVIKGVHAPLGDYRDWPAIEAWAAGIADALRAI